MSVIVLDFDERASLSNGICQNNPKWSYFVYNFNIYEKLALEYFPSARQGKNVDESIIEDFKRAVREIEENGPCACSRLR